MHLKLFALFYSFLFFFNLVGILFKLHSGYLEICRSKFKIFSVPKKKKKKSLLLTGVVEFVKELYVIINKHLFKKV